MNRRGVGFVGRAAELDVLRAALDDALEGRHTTVLVSGDAGIGKSRLVGELLADAAAKDAVTAVGSCVPAGLPYAPVVGLLRELGRRLDRTDAATRVLTPLAAAGGFRVADDAGKPYSTTPSILADLGKTRVFEDALAFVTDCSAAHPLVLVFEDVHWADSASVELLDFLARNAQDERVLIVATYRAEDIGHDHPLRVRLAELSRLARVVRVELTGLDREATRALLAGVLGEAPLREHIDDLHGRTHGNPFFLEELATAPPSVGLLTAALPANVHDVVMTRITALSDPTRHLLRGMAAVGLQVEHELLVALALMDDDARDTAIAEAVDRNVLVLEASGTGYRFRHALIREAVYATMLPGERTRLHRRIAEALQLQSTLGGPAELANHWWAAGAWAESLEPSLAAAEAAAALLSFPEADVFLERILSALERWPELEPPGGLTRRKLLEKASDTAYLAMHEERAVARAREALAALEPDAGPDDVARAHVLLGRNLWTLGDAAGAFAEYRAAVDALGSDAPSWTLAYIHAEEARGLMVMSRNEQSAQMCERAIAIARAAGARDVEGHALNTLGCTRAALGFIDEGIAMMREAIEIAEAVGSAEDVNRGYCNLAALLAQAGRLEEAAAAVFDLAATGEDLWGIRLEGAAGNSADALVMLGRFDDAEALLSRLGVRALGVCTPSPFRIPLAMELVRGRVDVSHRLLQRFDETTTLFTDVQQRGTYYEYAAQLALLEGRVDDAWDAIEQGVALTVGTDDLHVASEIRMVGVRVLAERAAHARAHGQPVEVDKLEQQASELIEATEALLAPAEGRGTQADPHVLVCLAQARAERSRITASDPDLWGAAALAAIGAREVYLGAYARWREAEALLGGRSGRARAHESLLEARALALPMRATPLLTAIDELAQRSRIDLVPVAAPTAAPVDDLGLTPREKEVLTHLVIGRTDQEIADALFISKKTASVHVSNLLRKLGVTNRVEAGKVGQAHGLGLAS